MNAMLGKLSNPRIHPSGLRGGGEELPGETIQQVTFLFASSRVTISLGLTVRDGWPLALREARFDRYRAAYAAAIDDVLKRCRTGSLTPEALKAAERAVAGLDGQLRSVAATLQADDFPPPRIFLDEMAEAVRALHDATTEKVLGGIDRYAGTTTGDLVVFMQRFNLRFGPALRPEEREAYHLLYAAMLHLNEQVAPAAAEVPGRFLRCRPRGTPINGPGNGEGPCRRQPSSRQSRERGLNKGDAETDPLGLSGRVLPHRTGGDRAPRGPVLPPRAEPAPQADGNAGRGRGRRSRGHCPAARTGARSDGAEPAGDPCSRPRAAPDPSPRKSAPRRQMRIAP